MKNEKLNKGDWYLIDNGLGPIRAQLKESPRQGRGFKTAVFMFVKGTDAGLFDEHGSVYTRDILEPCDPPATAWNLRPREKIPGAATSLIMQVY